jgi:hypothetical protein
VRRDAPSRPGADEFARVRWSKRRNVAPTDDRYQKG